MAHDPTPNGSVPHGIGVRVQRMDFGDQALILARLVQGREPRQEFSAKNLDALFLAVALPPPTKMSNVLEALRRRGFVTQGSSRGTWRITPVGRHQSVGLMSDLDLAALAAESNASSSLLGHIAHTVVPPALAPP